MSRPFCRALIAAALLPSPSLADERVGTIERGTYLCELPGSAASDASIPQPHEGFRIVGGSRYESAAGGGTYVRQGRRLVMTSGPRGGTVYAITRGSVLRKLDANGEATRLRCLRQGR